MKEKTKVVKGIDRNEAARIAMKQKNFQLRRNYLVKLDEIRKGEKVIEFHKNRVIDFQAQIKSGLISEKKKDGSAMNKQDLEADVITLNQTLEEFGLRLVFAKEDLFNMVAGTGMKIETIEQDIKNNFDEVNAFYDKHFKA